MTKRVPKNPIQEMENGKCAVGKQLERLGGSMPVFSTDFQDGRGGVAKSEDGSDRNTIA